jgi:DNA-binding NarL/FixJ family response regulator
VVRARAPAKSWAEHVTSPGGDEPAEELMSVRVLLVDDHPGFRSALAAALSLVDGVELVGEEADGESAVDATLVLRPDLVVMDLSMPGISGIEAMRKILGRLPEQPVVILTAHAAPAIEREAMAAGASGFLAKGTPFEDLLEALVAVSSGTTPRRATGA